MPSRVVCLNSCGLIGIRGYPVRVEVEVSTGMSIFRVVGLPDTTVSESRERVRSALLSSGFKFPHDHITVNLAPADVRKEGPIFDLPIAAGIVQAQRSTRHTADLSRIGLVGELSLDGAVRPVRGALSLAMTCRRQGLDTLILPRDNAAEASLVEGLTLWPVDSLRDVLMSLEANRGPDFEVPPAPEPEPHDEWPDMADIRGHGTARRALEIAAAGNHNLLMVGPPGCGKTMLAQRLPGLLPALDVEEALEVTQVHSAAGLLSARTALIRRRPFRAPHHTASPGGIVGGGSIARPGEISLAHGGVLFMDELPEFPRSVLEVLREPLESRQVTIARAGLTVTFPADFIFVACMNPCPCGYDGDPSRSCRCPRTSRTRYRQRVSGPLLDRIDLIIDVPCQVGEVRGESTVPMRERVHQARGLQAQRFASSATRTNGRMTLAEMREHCCLSPELEATLAAVANVRRLSARSVDRIVRVARTIADLGNEPQICLEHVLEAVQLRSGLELLAG